MTSTQNSPFLLPAVPCNNNSSNFFNYFCASWMPTFFVLVYGLDVKGASIASLYPFVGGAVAAAASGAIADGMVKSGMFSLTGTRKAMQGVSALGPALCCALLAAGGGPPEAGGHMPLASAQALFVGAVSTSSFLAAGHACGAQDISRRYSSLIYGVTSAFAVVAGAGAQYLTGALLSSSASSSDGFAQILQLVVLAELTGGALFAVWWRSDRQFE
jgi:hypothetical protein